MAFLHYVTLFDPQEHSNPVAFAAQAFQRTVFRVRCYAAKSLTRRVGAPTLLLSRLAG